MGHWELIASTVYYTGVGAVLLGTTIRFLYKRYHDYDALVERSLQNRKDIEALQKTESQILSALNKISWKLGIDVDLE